MVTKISLGKSLYGALAYNGEKINKEQGRLLATNRIFNDGSGTVDIAKAMEGFLAFMPATVRTEKPVLHISINPHPDDVLTDTELQEIPAHRHHQRGRERKAAQPGLPFPQERAHTQGFGTEVWASFSRTARRAHRASAVQGGRCGRRH